MPERWQKVGRGVDPQKQDRTDAALAMITSREGSAVSFLGAHGELGLVQGFAEVGYDDGEEKKLRVMEGPLFLTGGGAGGGRWPLPATFRVRH